MWTPHCLVPANGVAILVKNLIILVFLLYAFHFSIHLLIWAYLQKEELFDSFHLIQ
jgi:hypothetical protein